jgi:hypothetical protein
MKALVYDFRSEERFEIFAHILNTSLKHLRQLVIESEILQARLLLSIIDDVYKNKILIKLIKDPESYTLSLKEQEVISLKLLLSNYDFLKAPNPYTMALMSEINTLLEGYLINNTIKNKEPCVNLLSSDTNAFNTLIEG